MINCIQRIFSNPVLVFQAGLMTGIGIGGLVAYSIFMSEGD